MGKKKWRQEAGDLHRRILELLKSHEGRSFSQRDIKDDFFRLFREAYKGGYCCPLRYRWYLDTARVEWIWPKRNLMVCGDSIWQYAREQGWVHSEMSGKEDRCQEIQRVMDWWDAWTFAWEQLGYRERCYRNVEKDPHGDFLKSQNTRSKGGALGVKPLLDVKGQR